MLVLLGNWRILGQSSTSSGSNIALLTYKITRIKQSLFQGYLELCTQFSKANFRRNIEQLSIKYVKNSTHVNKQHACSTLKHHVTHIYVHQTINFKKNCMLHGAFSTDLLVKQQISLKICLLKCKPSYQFFKKKIAGFFSTFFFFFTAPGSQKERK